MQRLDEGLEIRVCVRALGFSADLLHVTRDFAVPSPIQMETWPVACAGRDVIGVAATGSGKTLAFGLPALAHTQAQLAAGVAQGVVMPECVSNLAQWHLDGHISLQLGVRAHRFHRSWNSSKACHRLSQPLFGKL